MIDTDKYEGHTPVPWKASHDVLEYGHIVNNTGWRVYVGEHEKRAEICNHTFDHDDLSEANARLIADAPLLLAEVKRLRSLGMGTGTDGIEATGWVKKINSLDAEVKRLREDIQVAIEDIEDITECTDTQEFIEGLLDYLKGMIE